MLDRITYSIANLLFSKHLDADYEMGLREGARVNQLVMASQIRRLMAGSPKYAQAGLEIALKDIEGRIH